MAKTRLTASIRNRLLSDLVARAHDEKDREARERWTAACRAAYAAAVPPEVQELLQALPEDFRRSGSPSVRDDWGRVTCIDVPSGTGTRQNTRQISGELFDELAEARSALWGSSRARAETSRKLSATIAEFRTAEDLLAAWPDVGPLLRPILEATAPAASTALVCAADLNKLCGLPVAEDAA